MIGAIVHYTGTNRQANAKAVCYPAIVLADQPNDKYDLQVIFPNVPALTKQSVPKGEVRQVEHWHNSDHGKGLI